MWHCITAIYGTQDSKIDTAQTIIFAMSIFTMLNSKFDITQTINFAVSSLYNITRN